MPWCMACVTPPLFRCLVSLDLVRKWWSGNFSPSFILISSPYLQRPGLYVPPSWLQLHVSLTHPSVWNNLIIICLVATFMEQDAWFLLMHVGSDSTTPDWMCMPLRPQWWKFSQHFMLDWCLIINLLVRNLDLIYCFLGISVNLGDLGQSHHTWWNT